MMKLSRMTTYAQRNHKGSYKREIGWSEVKEEKAI